MHDTFFPPHTLVLLKHAGRFGLQLAKTAIILTAIGLKKSRDFFKYLKDKYQEKKRRFLEVEEEDMAGGQRNIYRLSTSVCIIVLYINNLKVL